MQMCQNRTLIFDTIRVSCCLCAHWAHKTQQVGTACGADLLYLLL